MSILDTILGGPTQAQRTQIAQDMTNLPIWERQLAALDAKVQAAVRVAGVTPQIQKAARAIEDAGGRLRAVNQLALQAYDQAARAGKVKPIGANGEGGLAGTWGTILVVALSVAIIVAGFVLFPIWAAAVVALTVALALAVSLVNGLASVAPAVAAAAASVAKSGALGLALAVGLVLFLKRRRARA